MRGVRLTSFFALLLLTFLMLARGSGSNRKLRSITITGIDNGGQTSFTAAGTYSSAPITVAPLPASWSVGNPTASYQLTTQPFVVSCTAGPSVTVVAPVDPHAPSSGLIATTKMIVESAPLFCP